MRDFPSGTVTFLFTDIEGSTRRWEDDSPAMLAAVERHFALLDDAIQANNGVRFKVIGDAVQAAFPTALDGLLAAVAAQRAILAADWGQLGPLHVRMALHTGAATPRDGDYLAPSLNRLARLLATATGGQMLVSETTRDLLRDVLPADITLRDLGHHHLRDLRESEHVFQIAGPGLPADFPPLRDLGVETGNLPRQLTAFVGREREIAEVLRLFTEVEVRLLTVTGPGGTGKSRLALRAASDLVPAYPDGVWLVELASVTSADRIPRAIADALSIREIPGESATQTLRSYFREKRLLLVLDNFEHLLDGAPLVSDLLTHCPRLQVLATSRAPLRVAGEQELILSPLALPAESDAEPLEAALASEAVRLFVDRVRAVRPDFALTAQNAATIIAICRALDGLPLAIELAAARVRLLSPEAILARLGNRLALLTGGGRDLPARHQTLRAAIAWSYQLLSPDEQACFRRLSVFAGSWSLEAAGAVAGNIAPASSMIDALASLNDNSLIQHVPWDSLGADDEARFTMLQTIREFGAELLADAGEADMARDAHAAFFVELAALAKPHLSDREAVRWLNRLDADHDNFRAALGWLQARDEVVRAVQLAAALWQFWWLRGHISEGRAQLDLALAMGVSADATQERAEALDGAGVLAETQGEYDIAESLHRQALALSRNRDDQRGIARALGNLGVVAFDRDDLYRAESLLRESLSLAREANDAALIATALNDLGRVAYDQGLLSRAEALYQESLALRRQYASASDIARTLNNLGAVAYDQANYAEARRLFEESLSLYRESRDTWGAAAPLYGLALATRHEGDIPGAITLLKDSLRHFRETGDARNAATTLHELANTTLEQGDPDQALAAFREALAGFRAVDHREGIADALTGIATVHVEHGRFLLAARLLGAAAAIGDALRSEQGPARVARARDGAARARAVMGDDAFTAAWSAGRSLSLDAAVNEAMSAPPPVSASPGA